MTAAAPRPLARASVAALLLAPAVLIIAAGFLLPLMRLAILSVSAPGGPLAAYRELVTVDVYRIVLRNTVVLALVVSAVSLVIGFVLALLLTRLEAGWRADHSRLHRAAAVDQRAGADLFLDAHPREERPAQPFPRGARDHRSALAAALRFSGCRDRHGACAAALCGAADLCGAHAHRSRLAARQRRARRATRFTTFRRVLLPLSARGVATAAIFTFLLSLGFFVTPALLGGPSNTTIPMLIDCFVNERLDWPLAAAASMTLLAMALVVVGLARRFAPVTALAEVG